MESAGAGLGCKVMLTSQAISVHHARAAVSPAAGIGVPERAAQSRDECKSSGFFCAQIPPYGDRAQGAARLAGSLSRYANLRPVVTLIGVVVATSPNREGKRTMNSTNLPSVIRMAAERLERAQGGVR